MPRAETTGIALDIADDTFVVADPEVVAMLVRDPASWRTWWPDLEPTVTRDRGIKGMQWSVRGALVGSMEIWLEPWADGVLVHWYLRARPSGAPARGDRARDRQRAERVLGWKEQVHAVKDRLEAGREPGQPRPGCQEVKDRDEPAESQ